MTMPEWVPLNFALLKHPLNWFIVFFMVALPLTAFVIVHDELSMKSESEKR
jgi:hypothetical protein